MKIGMLILALLAITASDVFAQARPFTNRPVSQEEYARALETNNSRILNVDCGEIVKAASLAFGHEHADCRSFATYVRRLNYVPQCPQGIETSLARVLPTGTVDLYGFSRELREGETCLYDNQAGVWVASLSCGNFITRGNLPVQVAMAEAPLPPAALAPSVQSSMSDQAMAELLRQQGRQQAEIDRLLNQRPVVVERGRGGILRNPWFWTGVGVAVAAAFCTIPEPRCFKVTQRTRVEVGNGSTATVVRRD